MTLRFYHEFIAKDNAPIMVHICQFVGNMEEFLHYPQEYLRAVSFAPYHTCVEWVAARMNVGAMKSHMFSLIHHLKPDSFDAS